MTVTTEQRRTSASPPTPSPVNPSLEQTIEMRMRCVEAVVRMFGTTKIQTGGMMLTPEHIVNLADHFHYYVLRGTWPKRDTQPGG